MLDEGKNQGSKTNKVTIKKKHAETNSYVRRRKKSKEAGNVPDWHNEKMDLCKIGQQNSMIRQGRLCLLTGQLSVAQPAKFIFELLLLKAALTERLPEVA